MRNNNTISLKEYDIVRIEYVQVVKESVIPKGNSVVLNAVWNVYTSQKVPDPKLNKTSGSKTKRRVSDDKNKYGLKEGCKYGKRKISIK